MARRVQRIAEGELIAFQARQHRRQRECSRTVLSAR
jgi:hypothetical protein